MFILLEVLCLILPLTLLIIGVIFYKYPPKKINTFAGYRTTRSLKNIETWKEANRYSSKLMIQFSLPLLIVTGFGLTLAGRSLEWIAAIILISTVVSLTCLFVIIFLTEKHLKNM